MHTSESLKNIYKNYRLSVRKMIFLFSSEFPVDIQIRFCTKIQTNTIKVFQKNSQQFQSHKKLQPPCTLNVQGGCSLVVSLGLEPRTSCM